MADEKLTRSQLRQAKKVATGPLLGPITPLPSTVPPPEEAAPTTTRVARLGTIQDVRARIDGRPGEG